MRAPPFAAVTLVASAALLSAAPAAGVDRSLLWRSEEAFGRALPEELLRAWPRDEVYGYDVDHVDLELAVDFGVQEIDAAGALTLTITTAGLTELAVDLDDALTVTGAQFDGAPVSFTHTPDQVIIPLAEPPEVGSQHAVRVAYHGRPEEVGNKSMRFRGHMGVPLVYTLSTPYSTATQTVIPISHFWRPCKDVPNDKSTCALEITVPDSMLACANGVLTNNVDNGDGTRTLSWRHDYPVAPYLITLGATNYVTIEETYHGDSDSAAVQHFVFPEKYNHALQSFNITIPAMEFFASIFGEYPFIGEKYGMFLTYPGPAVEEQTMVAYPPTLCDGGHQYDWVLVHELAHMWWGDCVTCEDWTHVWLNEGFASYAEALWQQHLGGFPALYDYMQDMDGGPYAGTVYDPPYVWHAIVYEKGAWIVHMLRHVLGEASFLQLLADYRAAYEHDNVTTEEFVAVAESVYGQELDWYFDPWLYEEGRPDYEYSWWCQGDGPYTVHLRIDQGQTPEYPTYTMPIDVRVNTARNVETFVVWDSLRTQSFELVMAEEPTGIELDPDGWVLADFRPGTGNVGDRPAAASWLAQSAPNPASPATTIRFRLSRPGRAALRVFDANGRMVRTLRSGRHEAGEHAVEWDGRNDSGHPLGGGVYFYRLVSADGVEEKRLVLLR